MVKIKSKDSNAEYNIFISILQLHITPGSHYRTFDPILTSRTTSRFIW